MDEPTTTAAGGLLAKGLASIGFGAAGALRACQCPLRRDLAGVVVGSSLTV